MHAMVDTPSNPTSFHFTPGLAQNLCGGDEFTPNLIDFYDTQ